MSILEIAFESLAYEHQYELSERRQLKAIDCLFERMPELAGFKNALTAFRNLKPSSDQPVFYIVAPGTSLAYLSSESISLIERGTTMGFNASCFWSGRLDFHFMEVWLREGVSPALHDCVAERIRNGWMSIESVVFKNLWGPYYENCDSPLLHLQGKPSYLREIVIPASRTFWGLKRGVDKLPGSFSEAPDHLYQYGSTLFLCAYIGVLAGFRDIVFLGADLVNSDYFYKVSGKVPASLAQYLTFQQPQVWKHKTTRTSLFRVEIVRALAMLQERFTRLGVNFWAPHADSLLAREFPVWQLNYD